ncbi:DUF6157 family protein [Galbibacter sp.]|uniref:DUF6157 family protein n=1 Tax=Galbibacter sp. TaxID=2918471 RepID=UPI003A8CB490
MHTTNYINTLILVAEDTNVDCGTIPTGRAGNPTIAELQYKLLANNPYTLTSDDVLFQVYAKRKDLVVSEYKREREIFFSKGKPCFRASPLTKNYGFGIHADNHGKLAIYGMETMEYENLLKDPKIKKILAMRNSRKVK